MTEDASTQLSESLSGLLGLTLEEGEPDAAVHADEDGVGDGAGGDAGAGTSNGLSKSEENMDKNDAKKKLLVLALNGILSYREYARASPQKCYVGESRRQGNFLIYERPHMRSFLHYCFEAFTVAVWSSAREYNMRAMLDVYFSNEQKQKLHFAWGQDHCIDSGERDVSNPNKPLFLKDLHSIWCESSGIGNGFGPENTLLLDDSVYKARYTPDNAIHPVEWIPRRREEEIKEDDDDVLAETGPLRQFLDEVRTCDDVSELIHHARREGRLRHLESCGRGRSNNLPSNTGAGTGKTGGGAQGGGKK